MASYIGNKQPPACTTALQLLLVALVMTTVTSNGGDDVKARHEEWMARHGRTYKDEAEKARRLQVF